MQNCESEKLYLYDVLNTHYSAYEQAHITLRYLTSVGLRIYLLLWAWCNNYNQESCLNVTVKTLE